MSRLGDLGNRLYTGETAYDFVGKRKIWYLFSLAVIVVSLVGLGVRGLALGVDFEGGAVLTTPPTEKSVEEVRHLAEEASGADARAQELGNGAVRVTVTGLDTEESDRTRVQLAKDLGVDKDEVTAEVVGPSWGDQVTSKAVQGLIVFLVLVTIYLSIAFEWRMAVGAMTALAFDFTVTVGVYALIGFEVPPGTVVGVLTILGYSLYDTVVVFDKVKEKTHKVTQQTRHTYGELANLSVNATLVRSVNTSVVALLPVAGLLFIGSGLLGGGMLKDISLSLFIGLTAGTYSSLLIATPVLVDLSLRRPEIAAHTRKVLARRARRQDAADGDADDEEEPVTAGVGGPHGGDDRTGGGGRDGR